MSIETHNTDTCKLVATIFEMSFEELSQLSIHSKSIDLIELRADTLPEKPNYNHIKKYNPAPVIYSLRSIISGGAFNGSSKERAQHLIEASSDYDFIELEGDLDLQSEILKAIPPDKRIISWYGGPHSLANLERKLLKYQQEKAAYYKLVPRADKEEDSLVPLLLLKKINRPDVISYASGQTGQWTQIIAPYLRSPLVYGLAVHSTYNEGNFTLTQLIQDYNLPELQAIEEIYGIAGNPVHRSKSPKMHNNAYREVKKNAVYLPFHISDFNHFWNHLIRHPKIADLGFTLKGFTVVSPFKEQGLSLADKAQSTIIAKSLACNVLSREGNSWIADSTDFHGLEAALEDLDLPMPGLKVAIIGCGGAGRTMAAGLKQNGADVLLVNRSLSRAQHAAKLLELPYRLLSHFTPHDFDLVINATPLGKNPGEVPFNLKELRQHTAIIDLTYASGMTPLVMHSIRCGNKVVSGRKILLFQVRQQFKLLTGIEMPFQLAWELSGLNEELDFLNEIKNKNGFERQYYNTIQKRRREGLRS